MSAEPSKLNRWFTILVSLLFVVALTEGPSFSSMEASSPLAAKTHEATGESPRAEKTKNPEAPMDRLNTEPRTNGSAQAPAKQDEQAAVTESQSNQKAQTSGTTSAAPSDASDDDTSIVEWFEKLDALKEKYRPTAADRVILTRPLMQDGERIKQWSETAARIRDNYMLASKELSNLALPAGLADVKQYRDLTSDWYKDAAAVFDDLIRPRPRAKSTEELKRQLAEVQKRSEALSANIASLQELDRDLRKRYDIRPSKYSDALQLYIGSRTGGSPVEDKPQTSQTTLDLQGKFIKGHASEVLSVAWSPDGKRLASASANTVKVWNADNGREMLALTGHRGGVRSVAWSPDGKWLASGCGDGVVKVWDAEKGEEIHALKGHTSMVRSVAWNPDGKRLASASGDELFGKPGEVKIWDAVKGQETLALKGHSGNVMSVAWSPDGKRLASASLDLTVKVWDADKGREVCTFNGHTNFVLCVCWNPDGKRLASAGLDLAVRVWDPDKGKETLVLKGHTGNVNSVAWSPDGKCLASASWDGTVKVWDADKGQKTLALKGHTGKVMSVAWSPDGKRLASASEDKTVKVWNVQAR